MIKRTCDWELKEKAQHPTGFEPTTFLISHWPADAAQNLPPVHRPVRLQSNQRKHQLAAENDQSEEAEADDEGVDADPMIEELQTNV